MKTSLILAMAALPMVVHALAINAGAGLAKAGSGNHLEERDPIYPTEITVRGLPAYPTRVTVRGKRDVEATPVVADHGDGEGEAVKGLGARAPPKITLKTVRAKRDVGECTLKPTTVRTTPNIPHTRRGASVADEYSLRGYAMFVKCSFTDHRRR